MSAKFSLIGLDLEALEELVQKLDEPKFRASQLHSWIYVRNQRDFDRMTNLAKSFRAKLAEICTVGALEIEKKEQSEDGTIKYLFRLTDGKKVESVLIYFEEREIHAICLSTQVGCVLKCSFCATGKQGFMRNLTAAEIVEQFLYVSSDSGADVRNIVFMGQGEPLLNYDNTMEAVRILNSSAEIGMRRMTISTSGILPGIERLADDNPQINLAVSLHASNNETRSKIMPVNKSYPLEKLIPALQNYVEKTRRRVTIEYILISGINDTRGHAEKLNLLLKDLKCNINLIPYNPIEEKQDYERPSRERILAFQDWLLQKSCHKVTIRLERGTDIQAACGQLAGHVI